MYTIHRNTPKDLDSIGGTQSIHTNYDHNQDVGMHDESDGQIEGCNFPVLCRVE